LAKNQKARISGARFAGINAIKFRQIIGIRLKDYENLLQASWIFKMNASSGFFNE